MYRLSINNKDIQEIGNKPMWRIGLMVGLMLVHFTSSGQGRILSGKVQGTDGSPVVYATVSIISKEQVVTYTDDWGYFELKTEDLADSILHVHSLGYADKEVRLSLLATTAEITITLSESTEQIANINITAKSQNRLKKETGFNVELLDTKQFQNLSTDINQVLKTMSGINVRESGGLGSGFNLSLNGLSGNQVRYFMDGVPMESFGSSLQLNNFSTNLIKTVEVYKGVVPIHLGADALGGAINIITNDSHSSFLDASYSVGSFNTHRVSISGKHVDKQNRFYVLSSLFVNHSDNNYTMDSVKVFDLNLGNLIGIERVERFNDEYTSAMATVKMGSSKLSWADDISIGFTYSKNRNNYQHPDNNILRPLGDFNTRNTSLLSSFSMKKSINKTDLSANLTAGSILSSVIDTSTLKYNWRGDFINRSEDDPKGEIYLRRSLFKLSDYILRGGVNLTYSLNEAHSFTTSAFTSQTIRSGEDEVDELNFSFRNTNRIGKSIIATSYDFKNQQGILQSSVFAKAYFFNGTITTEDIDNNEIISTPSFTNAGYGIANKVSATKEVDIKASYEYAYRLPEAFEILGDGIYINPNPALLPESSHNINLGVVTRHQVGEIKLATDMNYFFRASGDFIRFLPQGPFGEYENLVNVRSTGVEGGLNVCYKSAISLSANATYQSITDQNRFDEGLPNTNYRSRVPNIPYFFVNSRLGVTPINNSSTALSIYGSTRYVHDFFLNWSRLGSVDSKNVIPSQLVHNIEIEASQQGGKYNISFAINNITNTRVFDNFNIQRPGRAYTLKIRYLYN